MGAEQSDQNGGLQAGFCCNSNLCNNDNNIENNSAMENGSNNHRKNNTRKGGHNSNVSGNRSNTGSKRDIGNRIPSQQFDQYGNPVQLNSSQNPQQPIPAAPVIANPNLNNSNLNAYGDNYNSQLKNERQNFSQDKQAQNGLNNFQNTTDNVAMVPGSGNIQNNNQQFPTENNQMISDYKQKLAECLHSSPTLQLEVISSASLPKGNIITINTLGLYGSWQSEREKEQSGSGLDGFTYFGSMAYVLENVNDGQPQHDDSNHNTGNGKQIVVNDFVIPSRNSEAAEQHRGRHFQIWYDMFQKSYFIKDLGIGFGVFKRMENGLAVLKDNMLVNVGEAYIVVNLLPEGAEEQGRPYDTLKLKMFGGPSNGEIYEFNMNEMKNGEKEILIGRTPDCDVKINDKLLSKVQSHIKIQYVQPNGAEQSSTEGNLTWTLFDGWKGKPSTNGTWLYINEDSLLQDGVIFKANQTIFSCKVINPTL